MIASVRAVLIMALVATNVAPSDAQTPANSQDLSVFRWRPVGPFRAGRTRAAAGVPSQPYTFYMAQVNGGLWKTTD